MTEIKDILNKRVSYQCNAFSSISGEKTIREILNVIKDDRYGRQMNELRGYLESGDKEQYSNGKILLPAVTFCATFSDKRRRSNIKDYNELIVIDIDKLDAAMLKDVKMKLDLCPYVFSYWESPSKRGIKGLVPLSFEYDSENIEFSHKIAFTKLVNYFQSTFDIELDKSGSDTTRLCFLSSDIRLMVNSDFKYFIITKDDIDSIDSTITTKQKQPSKIVKITSQKDALLNPKNKNSPQNRATMKSIIKYLSKRNLSITDNYNNWLRVAFAIANTFTHNIGEEYFLKLCRIDGLKHNEIESKNLLIHCYESNSGYVSFATIIHLAQELDYKTKNNN